MNETNPQQGEAARLAAENAELARRLAAAEARVAELEEALAVARARTNAN